MPELLTSPTSPAEALSLRPPLPDDVLKGIIGLLPEGDQSVMSLRALYENPASSPGIRAAAHDALVRLGQPPGPAASRR